ncbi:MAG: phosphonate ABC transporter substrate-binding protein [endosymbiont of Seepiophila jonesi]|uniref:Phosphonate ABC transporter substrate-binding protein n=1 Tax=endosymbiont of Lamellibrachia luymesi TaxID=2200907 RepID=A0A370DUX8_9GAMM|nr:MAG: phosphonate ABC transporter substrate-binding protein [endosymbiont of Lamellibrachia luymesi]RDH91884.1 MAG: phosphonate ABC transporter substrate-binding protein [endosymbiont of Seepiophila jonesi]
MFKRFLIPLLLLLTLNGINVFAAAGTTAPVALTFGVYQSDKTTVMYRKFLPVLEYLQKQMESSLGQPVDIELKIFKGYDQANDALVAGEVDFVRFGPASYALAKDRNEGIQLIAMEEKKGKKRFCGMIVVRSDSPIKTLQNLKGRRFAFGSDKSTIGRYLAQAEMVKAGIHAKDLAGYDYLGRHDKVFKAVVLGDYDAGALKEATFKRNNKAGDLRVLKTFENVTKPWIAREGLDALVVDAIRQGLLSLKDKDILKVFKASGFLPTSNDEYTFVRHGMRLSAQFGEK